MNRWIESSSSLLLRPARRIARRRHRDLRERAAFCLVVLCTDGAGDLEAVLLQEIGGAARACGVVGDGDDEAILRNRVQMFLEVRGLNAEEDRKAADGGELVRPSHVEHQNLRGLRQETI